MRVKVTDLTQYFGKDGLVIDQNFAFVDKSKSISELVAEMQTHGLQVEFIETTGELIRTKVSAAAGVRPDKSNEQSGWYVFNQLDDAWVCVFGNWRSGFEGKMTSYSEKELSQADKVKLQAQLNQAQERIQESKRIKQEEVSVYAAEKFNTAQEVVEHKYLTDKKVKSYGLKQANGNLLVPVYSITKNDNGTLAKRIKSLQYIFPDKENTKRFVGGGEIKGNVFLIGCEVQDLANLDSLIVVEGYATGASVWQATNVPCLVVFSANFCNIALNRLREALGDKCRFILALDNDTNKVGNTKANEVCNSIANCVVRLPSITGDYNDLANELGNEQVKAEILDSKFNIKSYAIRNLVNSPLEIEWLVDQFIPLAKNGVLAAPGGCGKSMSLLQLSLAIATGGTWWGKKILKRGSSAIFCAEDDLSEVHRRIDSLDPDGKRFDSPYDVYVIPVPEMKEPLILLREEGLTPEAREITEELKSIPNLVMVAFDPLQAFTTGSVSSSNEVSQLWGSYCANISARLGVATITIHHLNKGALTNDSDDAMSHRAEVRGASAIIDSARWCAVMWVSDEETCERICAEQGMDYDRMSVVKAALVKSNSGGVDYTTKTLIRRPEQAALEVLDAAKPFEWN